jgi:hypothetical protein
MDASKLTGSIANARIPAGAVTQHVTATDLTPVHQSIATLGLHMGVSANAAAFNLPNAFIDTFEDDSGITTETTVDRVTDGEYVASVYGAGPSIPTNTKLLIHSDQHDASTTFTDSSTSAHTVTGILQAHHDTNYQKFGATSMRFDGSGDYLNAGTSTDFVFGTGDFTIASWCRWNSVGYQTIMTNRDGTGSDARWIFQVTTSNKLGLDTALTAMLTSSTSLVNNTWYHCAATRESGVMRLFINGVLEDTYSSVKNLSANLPLSIGGNDGNTSASTLNGWMDEVLLIKGTALWTSNFTPPSEAYGGVTDSATGTLISDTQTAPAATTEVSGVILYKDNAGTATLGTHLKIYFTANNGTNWTEAASYGTAQTFSGTTKQVKLGKTTVASGTQVKLKAVWASQASGSMETQLHGWAVNY